MKQTQPPTTTPEAALRPVPGQKTATGVSDTWSRANLWGTQTFTTELRWGVRYSQSDPFGNFLGPHPYLYASGKPFELIDPLGLKHCKLSQDMEECLGLLYGPKVGLIVIEEAPLFVDMHYGAAATTRPLTVFVRNCESFLDNPGLMIHEFHHVMAQWWPFGTMGIFDYLWESYQNGYLTVPGFRKLGS